MGSPSLTGDRSRWHPVFSSHRGGPHHPRRTMPPPKVPGNAWVVVQEWGRVKGHGTRAFCRASTAVCDVGMHRCRCVDPNQIWSGIGLVALTVLALRGQAGVSVLGSWLQGVRYPWQERCPTRPQLRRSTCKVTSQTAWPGEPRPGEDASMEAALPRAGAGTVLLVVAVHQLWADCS